MILDLKNIRGYSFQEPQQHSWHHLFLTNLIQTNQHYLQQHSTHSTPSNIHILHFINRPSQQTQQVILPSYPQSYYSAFTPLRHQNYKWAN